MVKIKPREKMFVRRSLSETAALLDPIYKGVNVVTNYAMQAKVQMMPCPLVRALYIGLQIGLRKYSHTSSNFQKFLGHIIFNNL